MKVVGGFSIVVVVALIMLYYRPDYFGEFRICKNDNHYKKYDVDESSHGDAAHSALNIYIEKGSDIDVYLRNIFSDANAVFSISISYYLKNIDHAILSERARQRYKQVVSGMGTYKYYKKSVEMNSIAIYKSFPTESRWHLFKHPLSDGKLPFEDWLGSCYGMNTQSAVRGCRWSSVWKDRYIVNLSYDGNLYDQSIAVYEAITEYLEDHYLLENDESCK